VTAASVAKGTGAQTNNDYPAGESGTAGMVVYHKASDSKWYKAQADATPDNGYGTGVGPGGIGIATHDFRAGQPLQVQTGGQYTVGATVAVGVHYYLSATAGGICPVADLASTNYVTRLFYGVSTTVGQLDLKATGQQLA